MATCGEYELEKAIGWGRHSTFFSARILGAKGPVQIVVRRARVVERAVSHAFLRAAAEQEAAVGAGCRRLAPILGYDCDETGFAYYATARYETSLAEILEAGCKVDGGQLREIVTGVLGALSELRQKSLRAHGNLTPGNILLDAGGRVFLTDLAPSAKDATTGDDLFALGTLIYQLIRRTARIGMLNPPLDYSPAWTDSLGDDAEGWRELTNRLLTKSRNMGTDALKAATADVKSLASLANIAEKAAVATAPIAGEFPQEVTASRPKKRSPLPKVIAIILLLAGGGGGFLWWKDQEAKKKAAAVAAAEAAAKLEHDKALPETIKALRADLKRPLPPEFDKTLTALLTRIGKSLDASGNINDVTSLLGNWDLPEKMRTQAATWRTAPREWNALAGQLEAAAQIELDGTTSIIEQLRTAIARRSAANELDSVWTEVTFTLKDLDLARQTNRLLPDFEPWAVYEIVSAKNLADAPARAGSALEKLREVLKFQREKGGQVLWARFEKDAADVVRTPASGLMQGWPDRWQQAADRLTGPSDAKKTEWNNKLADAEPRMAKLRTAEQAKWKAIFQEASDAKVDALASDVPRIDALVAKLQGMRLPIEDAKEEYAALLRKLKKNAEDATTPAEGRTAQTAFDSAVKSLFAKYDSETKKLLAEYQKSTGTAGLVGQMDADLKTQDRIVLDLPDWKNITPEIFDPTAAWYSYSKDGLSAQIPFLQLGKTRFAMAAIETPLILARMSGSPAKPPSQGPKIRKDGFFPETDWLWKAPTDLINRPLGIRYFALNVSPGDVGQEYSPATWLSFPEANAMAAKLGGELPTVEQWTSALSQAGGVQRLRGRAWTEQVKLLPQWLKQTGEPQFSSGPDWGSFSKKTGLNGASRDYITDLNPAPGAAEDGKVWLRWVMPDGPWTPKSGFTHLIGNAAEWVRNNESPAVIGGSVVSPPSLPTKVPIPVRDGAYFDVTFRLVARLADGGEGAGLKKFKETALKITVPTAPAQ